MGRLGLDRVVRFYHHRAQSKERTWNEAPWHSAARVDPVRGEGNDRAPAEPPPQGRENSTLKLMNAAPG